MKYSILILNLFLTFFSSFFSQVQAVTTPTTSVVNQRQGINIREQMQLLEESTPSSTKTLQKLTAKKLDRLLQRLTTASDRAKKILDKINKRIKKSKLTATVRRQLQSRLSTISNQLASAQKELEKLEQEKNSLSTGKNILSDYYLFKTHVNQIKDQLKNIYQAEKNLILEAKKYIKSQ